MGSITESRNINETVILGDTVFTQVASKVCDNNMDLHTRMRSATVRQYPEHTLVYSRPRSATTTSHFPTLHNVSSAWSDHDSITTWLARTPDDVLQQQPKSPPSDHSDENYQVGGSLVNKFKRWRAKSEPRIAWLLLFFALMPVNMLMSAEYASLGIYYVEFVEYFEATNSAVGVIGTVKFGVMSVSGE